VLNAHFRVDHGILSVNFRDAHAANSFQTTLQS
jgi:hypothetical protein